MNPHLQKLQPYPFERLDQLKRGLKAQSTHKHISLALGEPKHNPPAFVVDALAEKPRLIKGLNSYPATRGTQELRESIAGWLNRRYSIKIDPVSEILPVNGTREGLFSFGQAMLSGIDSAVTVMPNPFYQIYEGASLLRGVQPYFVPSGDRPRYEEVPEEIWERAELVYTCSPNNPTGYVLTLDDQHLLIEKALKHDFTIAADECYSEIYYDDSAVPPGLLQAASEMGNSEYSNCVSFNSLSKRSNLPGLRSGFVAGDRRLLEKFYDYRTYHGCAMPLFAQEVSSLAWDDEQHVIENRALYREKFDTVRPMVSKLFNIGQPSGAFFFWLPLPMDDEKFTEQLFVEENITVLPGSYLARSVNNENPGSNRIRVALVATLEECVHGIRRLCEFSKQLTS